MSDHKVVTLIDAVLNAGTTHEAEFLFDEGPVSAATIVADADRDGLPDAPPEAANYRPAEVEAIACWNCSHFQRTGLGDDEWPVGICHLWEAQAQGESVCDKFTADATMHPMPPHEYNGENDPPPADWAEEYSMDSAHLVELQFADDEYEKENGTGLIWKPILRTGEWPRTPSSKGVVNKALKVVRDGVSSATDRIISLSEIKENFDKGAYPYVPIPLTDEENKDHKNLLRLNTGFIRKLKIRDEGDGMSKLVAGMQFTEPDARAKVERRTIPDVSSGIFFGINRPNGDKFNAALNHVVLTHKPFMDGLGEFEFSDGEQPETIETLQLSADPAGHEVGWPDVLTVDERKARVQTAVDALLSIPEVEGEGNVYTVESLDGTKAVVASAIAETSWDISFSLDDKGVVNIEPTDKWQPHEDVQASQEDEQPDEPAAASEVTVPRNETPLQQARRRRADRARQTAPKGGDSSMAKIRSIDQVNFSDEADAKKYAEELAGQNEELSKSQTTRNLEKRIDELKDMGFAEMPGFLAEYRNIFLSDDGEAAMVLFSYDDNNNQTGSNTLTGIELADRLIGAIPTDKEGKILLSGQALDTGTNDPPPDTDTDEEDTEEKVNARTEEVAKNMGWDLGDDGKEK